MELVLSLFNVEFVLPFCTWKPSSNACRRRDGEKKVTLLRFRLSVKKRFIERKRRRRFVELKVIKSTSHPSGVPRAFVMIAYGNL
ncbi:hypothetical protein ACFIOY_39880 [Bradyrhizobium sp. TZ2]